MARHARILPTLALATAGSLWGTGFFFGKIALAEMPVATMVLYRFAFASVALLPIAFFYRLRFSKHEWRWLLAGAGLGVPVQFLVQFKGLSLTTASHAALMVGTLPMLLAVAAVVFSGERMHLKGWGALAASTLGAALIASSGNHRMSTSPASATGDLLVVLSMFAAVAWILISKRLVQQHSPVIVTAVLFWLGTLMLAVAVAAKSGVPSIHYSGRAWAAVAVQGVFATATTTILWNWGLSRVPASRAGAFVNMEPLVGSLLGVFLLHESLGGTALLGGTLIIGGAAYFSSN